MSSAHSSATPGLIPPQLLLQAYASGIFPMAPSHDSTEIHWFEPEWRGILPLDGFHVSKNLAAHLRKTAYEVRINSAFEAVVRACADRPETWISTRIHASYTQLHCLGFAHSLELYLDGQLVGGQYGVALGSAFFGESMFHTRPDADKAALAFTHRHLVARGFTLWDCQYWTPHLGRFGAIEIAQADYLALLADALTRSAQFA